VYEETVRIPMLFRLPPPSGREIGSLAVAEPVGTIDIVPTILDLLSLPFDESLQGESLLPLMAAAAGVETPADGRARPNGDKGVPEGRPISARYVVSATSGNSPSFAFIRGDKKLILRKNGRCELYDLSSDPGETINLAVRNQFSVRIAAQRAVEWLGGVIGETLDGRDAAEASLDPGTREDLEALGYLE
jgi:arylsulfatase A-like enzyme